MKLYKVFVLAVAMIVGGLISKAFAIVPSVSLLL